MIEGYLPARFFRIVAAHVAKNLSLLGVEAPLILGIHGPSGEGKTKQCEMTLQKMNVKVVTISGGELEHKQAGRPGELVRDRYLEASRKFNEAPGGAAAVLVNDFDTGLGIWGDGKKSIFQYTVNLQNVFATFMNIADNPTDVDGQRCNRVPIIITGNHFGVLHEPLTRDGRMTKFKWEPTLDERILVTQAIFADLPFAPEDVKRLVSEYPNKSIAFFSHVKSLLIDNLFYQYLEDNPSRLAGIVEYSRKCKLEDLFSLHLSSWEVLNATAHSAQLDGALNSAEPPFRRQVDSELAPVEAPSAHLPMALSPPAPQETSANLIDAPVDSDRRVQIPREVLGLASDVPQVEV